MEGEEGGVMFSGSWEAAHITALQRKAVQKSGSQRCTLDLQQNQLKKRPQLSRSYQSPGLVTAQLFILPPNKSLLSHCISRVSWLGFNCRSLRKCVCYLQGSGSHLGGLSYPPTPPKATTAWRHFFFVTAGEGSATGIWCAEGRDAVTRPPRTGCSP